MSGRLMRAGLAHKWAWAASDMEHMFFSAIDESGGWPSGCSFVGFDHSDERAAGFTNSPHNDGWWTILASADDYYLWKLSPEALQRIADAVLAAARITPVDAARLRIKDSKGWPRRRTTPKATP